MHVRYTDGVKIPSPCGSHPAHQNVNPFLGSQLFIEQDVSQFRIRGSRKNQVGSSINNSNSIRSLYHCMRERKLTPGYEESYWFILRNRYITH